jgi:hypothetical protein
VSCTVTSTVYNRDFRFWYLYSLCDNRELLGLKDDIVRLTHRVVPHIDQPRVIGQALDNGHVTSKVFLDSLTMNHHSS